MSKKIGKFILAATAVTTAAAAAYYFMRKDKAITIDGPDEDLDDFSDESVDDSERSYVELNHETGNSEGEKNSAKEPVSFTTLTKQIKKTAGRVVGRTIEAVEDFFDDEDKENAAEEESAVEGSAEDAASAEEPASVKIEEDIVDAVKDAAAEAPAEDAGNSDPAVQIEADTVKAVQAEDTAAEENTAEETEVFLDEEEDTEEEK